MEAGEQGRCQFSARGKKGFESLAFDSEMCHMFSENRYPVTGPSSPTPPQSIVTSVSLTGATEGGGDGSRFA